MDNIDKLKMINARMHDLSDMISDLNQKYRELEKERYELMSELSKKAIGMCLQTDDEVIRITGTPQIEWDDHFHMSYGQRLPCLTVTNDNEVFTDFLECHYETDPVMYLRSNYKEISNEEFEKRLAEVFEYMRMLGKEMDTDERKNNET